ncbi:hypothetical protein ABIB82_002446 [Bradyrhizobium sp. i1.8.4]|uniref:hypothetical protein n=1 Tax=unclassified Bradyrhizobium TaxID=2631580 RepID=UPI003D196846
MRFSFRFSLPKGQPAISARVPNQPWEAITGELKRQAAGRPDLLRVPDAGELAVNGTIDLDAWSR